MPTNKNAQLRYIALDKCFRDFSHRYYIQDLVEQCEASLYDYCFDGSVSVRQIYKDIDFMKSRSGYNAPIESLSDGRRKYYRYTNKDYSITHQIISDSDAKMLKTMVLTLKKFSGFACYEWVDEVVSRLECNFHLNGGSENLIGFEQNEQFSGLKFLSSVVDATINHQVVEIMYHTYKNGGRDIRFLLSPYYVKQYNNRWFLLGRDHEWHNVATIALDRIRKIELRDNIDFEPNESIDFSHYFDDVVGVTKPDKGATKQHVVMRFAPSRYHYVDSKPLHPSQRVVSAEDCTICLDVFPNKELISQILSYGADVEVLEPASLRQAIVDEIKKFMGNYQL